MSKDQPSRRIAKTPHRVGKRQRASAVAEFLHPKLRARVAAGRHEPRELAVGDFVAVD